MSKFKTITQYYIFNYEYTALFNYVQYNRYIPSCTTLLTSVFFFFFFFSVNKFIDGENKSPFWHRQQIFLQGFNLLEEDQTIKELQTLLCIDLQTVAILIFYTIFSYKKGIYILRIKIKGISSGNVHSQNVES